MNSCHPPQTTTKLSQGSHSTQSRHPGQYDIARILPLVDQRCPPMTQAKHPPPPAQQISMAGIHHDGISTASTVDTAEKRLNNIL